jgi:RND family efflux transporter MFP subunit
MKLCFVPFILIAPVVGLAGCGVPVPAAQKSAPPAKVAQPAKEAELATIILTPEAEQRLGIRPVPVERKSVSRVRTLGGDVVVLPGRSLVVTAPLAGTLEAPSDTTPLVPGQRVTKGQVLFSLQILLTPPDRVRLAEVLVSLAGSRVDAEGQVERTRVQVDAAKIAVARAEQLVRDKAGSHKALDEAQAQLGIAQATLHAAEAHRDLLVQTTLDAEAGKLVSLPVESPQDGILQDVAVSGGQTVTAGTRLFEVVRHDVVWIRVPVYVGDLSSIDTGQAARVGELAGADPSTARVANPVVAPPAANAAAATADLFYELPNSDGSLRPGQRLGVVLPLRADEDSLVVPWSAVLHDIHGGTWVYEATGPQTFIRRRVQVRYVVDSVAVLATGPKPGAMVVTDGAAELFGTEFGFGK